MRFRLPALLLTSLLATAPLASAQSAAPTTPTGQATVGGETLIPLDSRPATSTLPAQMAGLLGGTVHVVPAALLGNATRGADPAALTAWLAAQPKDGPLIVSLDALAYGASCSPAAAAIPWTPSWRACRPCATGSAPAGSLCTPSSSCRANRTPWTAPATSKWRAA